MECQDNSLKTSYLTKTEKLVVDLLCGGRSEKEIADELHVSVNTVNNHMKNIRHKLGVNKNTEIMLYKISEINGKEFNLADIRKYGINIILVLINVCELQSL